MSESFTCAVCGNTYKGPCPAFSVSFGGDLCKSCYAAKHWDSLLPVQWEAFRGQFGILVWKLTGYDRTIGWVEGRFCNPMFGGVSLHESASNAARKLLQ